LIIKVVFMDFNTCKIIRLIKIMIMTITSISPSARRVYGPPLN